MRQAKRLLPLFVIQFFTWLGLFSVWIYSVPVVAHYYLSQEKNNYDDATFWVGICFALYAILGTLLSFYINFLIKKYPPLKIHALALFAGSIGLLIMYFSRSVYLLFFSFSLIGIAWSGIGSIPYTMVGKVITDDEHIEKYYSLFNFSTVLPQVIAAFLFSFLIKKWFNGNTINIILVGSICFFIASVCSGVYNMKKTNS